MQINILIMGGMPLEQIDEKILIFTKILNKDGDAIEELTQETTIIREN